MQLFIVKIESLLVEVSKPALARMFFTTLGVIVLIFHFSCFLIALGSFVTEWLE